MKSVNGEQVTLHDNNINPFRFRQKYPDLRFHCPNCGTLEVLVAWESAYASLKSKCLDCKKGWSGGVGLL